MPLILSFQSHPMEKRETNPLSKGLNPLIPDYLYQCMFPIQTHEIEEIADKTVQFKESKNEKMAHFPDPVVAIDIEY